MTGRAKPVLVDLTVEDDENAKIDRSQSHSSVQSPYKSTTNTLDDRGPNKLQPSKGSWFKSFLSKPKTALTSVDQRAQPSPSRSSSGMLRRTVIDLSQDSDNDAVMMLESHQRDDPLANAVRPTETTRQDSAASTAQKRSREEDDASALLPDPKRRARSPVSRSGSKAAVNLDASAQLPSETRLSSKLGSRQGEINAVSLPRYGSSLPDVAERRAQGGENEQAHGTEASDQESPVTQRASIEVGRPEIQQASSMIDAQITEQNEQRNPANLVQQPPSSRGDDRTVRGNTPGYDAEDQTSLTTLRDKASGKFLPKSGQISKALDRSPRQARSTNDRSPAKETQGSIADVPGLLSGQEPQPSVEDDAGASLGIVASRHSTRAAALATSFKKESESADPAAGRRSESNLSAQLAFRAAPASVSLAREADGAADKVENVLTHYLQECRADSEYWHATWLKKARYSPPQQSHLIDDKPTSVFKNMKPLPIFPGKKSKSGAQAAEFQVEVLESGRPGKVSSWNVPCNLLVVPGDGALPTYSHYVSIKNNFLAHNETVLQRWPYFGDDFDSTNLKHSLEENYFLDISHRQRKLDTMLRAERFAPYAEDILKEIGCAWSDVLRFLLEQSPDVGTEQAALTAFINRDKFCDEDFSRTSQRWRRILALLPASTPEVLGRAAMLCERFQKATGLRFWHVARRAEYVRQLCTAQTIASREPLTCRICMRHNCPYHGEIHESRLDEEPQNNESADTEIVETDIINPQEVNFRHRVEFPAAMDRHDVSLPQDLRRSLKWWQDCGILWRAEDRAPYYPCSHPGKTCSSADCSCYRNNIPCEKMCSCPQSCQRKWQGCACATVENRPRKGNKMICFEDERCACYGLNRECDPDLCGACGVCDVLDPRNRYDDGVLIGRCNNANIQRGVAKRTLLGTSAVHGFGLYAGQKILEHDFVGEYKGEIITKSESDRRAAVYEHQKLSYLFSLNKAQEIDSTYFGNKVRFINHADSKKANLYPRIMLVGLVHRIGLFGSRPVKDGEELFFDYGPEFPDEQLGGVKAVKKEQPIKAAKSAPRVRNSLLTRDFFDVDYRKDALGNRRAVKAGHDGNWEGAKGSTGRGRSPNSNSVAAAAQARSKSRRKRGKRLIVEDDEEDGDGEHDTASRVAGNVTDSERNDEGRDEQIIFEGFYVHDANDAAESVRSDDAEFQPEDGSESTSDESASHAYESE